MALDIAIIVVFVISTLRGRTSGLGDTVIRFLALAASVAAGVFLTEQLAQLVMLTSLDEILIENLETAAQSETIDLAEVLPGGLGAVIALLGGSLSIEIARCAQTLIRVLSFVVIVAVVWSIGSAIRRRCRKSKNIGALIGTVDATVGLVYGAARGAILVLLLLALMLPFAGIFLPDKISWINDNLNNSYIAGPLYDWNPILSFIKKLSL